MRCGYCGGDPCECLPDRQPEAPESEQPEPTLADYLREAANEQPDAALAGLMSSAATELDLREEKVRLLLVELSELRAKHEVACTTISSMQAQREMAKTPPPHPWRR